jgi:hypothetical protein
MRVSITLLVLFASTIRANPLIQLLEQINTSQNISVVDRAERYGTEINKVSKPGNRLEPKEKTHGLVRVCQVWAVRVAEQKWLTVKVDHVNTVNEAYFFPEHPDRSELDLMQACKIKGQGIYARIVDNRKRADKADYVSLYDKYQVIDGTPRLVRDSDILASKQILKLEYTKRYTKSKPKVARAFVADAYQNGFNVDHGLIVAHANDGSVDENAGADRLPWSEITYQEYFRLANAAGKPISNLKYVVRHTIVNTETMMVMMKAFKEKLPKTQAEQQWLARASNKDFSTDMFDPENAVFPSVNNWVEITRRDHPDLFYAILGTDNGSGPGNLLADHHHAIDKTDIKSFVLFSAHLIAEYEKV